MVVSQTFAVNMVLNGAEQMNRGFTKVAVAMEGFQRKMSGSAVRRFQGDVSGLQVAVNDLSGKSAKATTSIGTFSDKMETAGNKAASTKGKVGRLNLGLGQAITTGVQLGIVWQGINIILTTVGEAMNKLAFRSVDVESSLVSLSAISKTTGRDLNEINKVIEQNVDSLTDRLVLTKAVTRLLSTSLTTVQIDQFIKAVKDGSAAMGEDFNVQMERMALGLKRLEPRIADNIGAEFKLNIEYRQAAKELGKLIPELTTLERQQTFLNAVLRETGAFQGVWTAQLETARGKIASVNVEFDKLAEVVGNTEVWKTAGDGVANLIKLLRVMIFEGKEIDSLIFLERKAKEETEEFANNIEKLKSSFAALGFIGDDEFNRIETSAVELSVAISSVSSKVSNLKDEIKILGSLESISEDELVLLGNLEDELATLRRFESVISEGDLSTLRILDSTSKFTSVISILRGELERLESTEEELNEMLVETANEIEDVNDRILELRLGIVITDGEIIKTGKSLSEYNRELFNVNESLDEWTDKQRDAESAVKDLEKALLSKRKALDPDANLKTEQKLVSVQRDLEKARRDQERTQERLLKRVEPKIFRERQEEAIEAEEEVSRLTKEETKLKGLLGKEISELESKMKLEIERRNEAIESVTNLQLEQDKLNDILRSSQNEISSLSEQVQLLTKEKKLLKEEIEDELTPALSDIQTEIAGVISEADSATSSIISMADSIKSLREDSKDPILFTIIERRLGTTRTDVPGTNPFGFATGTKFVPHTGMFMLHRGEAVLNKGQQKAISNRFESGAIVINAGNRSVRDLFNEIERESRRRIDRRS